MHLKPSRLEREKNIEDFTRMLVATSNLHKHLPKCGTILAETTQVVETRVINSKMQVWIINLKLSCDSRFQRAFTACVCVFKVITLVWANQGNYF